MEQESSFSRMERTLWSVWCFITETVNRILRPQPAETTSTDPALIPESRPDGEPPDAEDCTVDSAGGGIDEEQPHSSVTLLSASIVAWNVCTNDSKSDEEQLGGGNEDCKDTRQEDCTQTGNEHAGMEKGGEESGGELVKQVTLEDDDETTMEIQVMEDDGGEDSKEDGGEDKLHTGTEEEEDAAAALMMEEVNIGGGVLELSFETKNNAPPSACHEEELIVATQEVRGESDQLKDEGEEEDTKEGAKQQAKEEEQDQENRIIKDEQREDLTQCSEDAVQETGRDTAEFTEKREDVVVTVTQTTTQTDVSEAESILDQSVVDIVQVEEEWPSSEVHSKEEVSNSSEPEPEGETEPETSEDFKDIPQVEIEGRAPVSHGVNPKAWEETREGVPELNNELGSDENKTQSVVEGGNDEEIHITQLPEEVESEERASLKNTGDDCLPEEERGLDEKELAGNLHFAQVEAVNLEFEEEEAELVDTSMKVDIKPSGKEESGPDEPDTDLCDEAQAVEPGISRDETSEILKTEMTETSFCRESMKSTKPDDASSLPEETTDCRVLDQIEPKLSDDEGTQLTGVETEEKESTDEEEEEIIPSGAKLIVSQKDKETPLIVESGLSLHPDTHVRRNQPPLEAPQIDMIEIQTETESKTSEPNNLVMSEDETEHFPRPEEERKGETSSSIGEHKDVIDEEILDLWLETAMSKDSCTEEEPREDTMENKMTGKSGESSEEEEQLPASVSDTETPSSTLDSGFLDQSFGELLPLKSESHEDIHDMLASASKSDDLSDFSAPDSESLIEETVDSVESFLREEESVSVTESRDEKNSINEESESSEEKSLETKAGVTADDTSLIETKAQDEPLEETVFGSSGEIKLTESRQAETETLLEDREVLTEHSAESEENQLSVDAPDHSWPLPGLGTSENQNEVDAPGLNFTAQKSRITAKNPRARRPSNPRALIQKPSEDPTLSSHVSVKAPPGMPLGRLGIGIKLPGFGGGIPVLKKKQKSIEVVDRQDTEAQEPEKAAEEGSESVKPKWKPPGHPGFGMPLMSELKTKLKKTPKE